MKPIKEGDNIVIVCRCHKKVSDFMVESSSIYADEREISLALENGYYVNVNPHSQYDWALCPCEGRECPWKHKFSNVHGKASIL